MPADATAHVRIARPTRDLAAAERFWVAGLGLGVQYRHDADGTSGHHALLMVGWPDAAWHLELVHDPSAPVEPSPTPEDLLVVYLGEEIPDALVKRLERHGGTRCPRTIRTRDTWGVTLGTRTGTCWCSPPGRGRDPPAGAVRARLTRDSVQRPAGPPPLTEAETAEAEAQLGITFPRSTAVTCWR